MQKINTLEQAKHIVNSIELIQKYIDKKSMNCITNLNKCSLLNGITESQFNTIHVIYRQGQVTLTQLARILKVSLPSASTTVDRLIKKGILLREQDSDDRRKVIIKLSPNAFGEFKALHESILKSFKIFLDKIGPKTASQWLNVMEKIQLGLKN